MFHDEGGHYATRTLPNTHSQFGHDEDNGGSGTPKRWKRYVPGLLFNFVLKNNISQKMKIEISHTITLII